MPLTPEDLTAIRAAIRDELATAANKSRTALSEVKTWPSIRYYASSTAERASTAWKSSNSKPAPLIRKVRK